ncbi:MAG: A/G-specific adenine glycosylase [Anaerolineales bacterium]|jgi:A/G-specific adenine glycosylase
MTHKLAEALLVWYASEKRDLPWRYTRDPYAVWISEVMLQQTQVETVVPYFQRWMERYPSLQALAEAPIDDVLNLWEGLGYYRRAHALHRAARERRAAGYDSLPDTVTELESLPGIGPYTARAVAAIAFGADVLALDGNLRRVLARIFNVELDISTADGERKLRQLGESVLPRGKASAFNQALMDLGATVCVVRAPRCSTCPVAEMCAAFQAGVEEERPIRPKRKARPHRRLSQVALWRSGSVLVGRRPQHGLLAGLWAFPGETMMDDEAPESAARRTVEEQLRMSCSELGRLGEVEHAYTHFTVTAYAYVCDAGEGHPTSDKLAELSWVELDSLPGLAMGKVDRAIAQLLTNA